MKLSKGSELNLRNVAPLAAHIKEINNIDPFTVDAFHVNEIKNIEPINIARFNVTDLPLMNMAVRQLPDVNFNVRKLPAVSVGTHQNFEIPSSYTLRAQLMGIEFLRLHLNGQTSVIPREKFRREKGKVDNRSYAVPATAGNPAIPSSYRNVEHQGATHQAGKGTAYASAQLPRKHMMNQPKAAVNRELTIGQPRASFSIQDNPALSTRAENCVMSGE